MTVDSIAFFACHPAMQLSLQESPCNDRTSAFCVVMLFCVRSGEWTKSILRTFCETSFAGRFLQEQCRLAQPAPRLLSFHEESNQRRAKEEVSSLDSPLRGTSPRELRKAKFSPPVCSASKQMSGFASTTSGSRRLRRCSNFLGSGVSKGACPFRWRSRNQVVPCAPFVHFLAIGNGPRGAGAGSLPANRFCRNLPTKITADAGRVDPQKI